MQNKLNIIIGAKAAKFLYPNRDFVELVFSSNSLNDKPAIVLPHPSPLNIKWFKDHPNFEEKRLPEVRELISNVLK
ncbi:uracil-DNA glycosylase family protein [Paenibacillus solani]|uniref:uracil-DNA glycosylase family protein n=1 Tax=Paenibacillus solani TaxID=1705565 RepID=UPI003D27C8F7